jgi:hypothetical protein
LAIGPVRSQVILTVTTRKKDIQLPHGVRAIGLSPQQAAIFWGISPNHFAQIEREQKDLLPKARRLGNRKLYSEIELEQKFHELPFWDDSGNDDEWAVN